MLNKFHLNKILLIRNSLSYVSYDLKTRLNYECNNALPWAQRHMLSNLSYIKEPEQRHRLTFGYYNRVSHVQFLWQGSFSVKHFAKTCAEQKVVRKSNKGKLIPLPFLEPNKDAPLSWVWNHVAASIASRNVVQ